MTQTKNVIIIDIVMTMIVRLMIAVKIKAVVLETNKKRRNENV